MIDGRPPPQHHQSSSQPNRLAQHEESPPSYPNQSAQYEERPPHPNLSTQDDESPPHPNLSAQHDESPPHPNFSTQHEESSPHPNFSAQHEESPPNLNRSGRHEPERPSHTANAVSKLQKYFENNRWAAQRDPFGHLKSFPEEIQRVLKAIPPSPQFCWSECTGQRKAVCVSTYFQRPTNTIFRSVFVNRLGLIMSVKRIS